MNKNGNNYKKINNKNNSNKINYVRLKTGQKNENIRQNRNNINKSAPIKITTGSKIVSNQPINNVNKNDTNKKISDPSDKNDKNNIFKAVNNDPNKEKMLPPTLSLSVKNKKEKKKPLYIEQKAFINNSSYIPLKLNKGNETIDYHNNIVNLDISKKKKDENKYNVVVLPDKIKANLSPSSSSSLFDSIANFNEIIKNIKFQFADVSTAIETSGRRNELRSGTLIDDFKNFKNFGKSLYNQAPSVVKEAKHKFALLLGGDCNKNLGDACNRDLIAVWAEILNPVYNIKQSDVWITTQVTPNIKKTFKSAKIREMTPSNFEETLAEILSVVLSKPSNEKIFIYLHYSGHGYQIPNTLKYKKGNRDEAILVGPTTLATGADIRDNFLSQFKSNVHIFSLWDACHSGSIADLPFKWDGSSWEECTINENKRKKIEAKIVSISACDDNQVDAQITGNIIGYGGALTVYFYETNQYYKIDNPINVHAKISLAAKKIRQLPILTSSWKFR